jgi:hypothetical protein
LEVEEAGADGGAGGLVGGGDPAGERDRLDQVGRQGAEDLVQGAEGDAGDDALVRLADLAVGAGYRLDAVPRLDVAVGADRGYHAAGREFQFDREAAGPRIVSHLVVAREALGVAGGTEHAAGEPAHGFGVAGRERRLAAGDVGVPGRRLGALLGHLPVVGGFGDGESAAAFGLLGPVLADGGVETGPGFRRLAALAAAAHEAAETSRRDGGVVLPLRRGPGRRQRAGIEIRGPRGGQQPFEGQRAERQGAGQHLAERLHPRLRPGGLLLGLLLLGGQVLLLADPLLIPVALPLLARPPVVLAPLHGQALLQRREAPASGHDSPGLCNGPGLRNGPGLCNGPGLRNGPGMRANRYSTTITGGQVRRKLALSAGPANSCEPDPTAKTASVAPGAPG